MATEDGRLFKWVTCSCLYLNIDKTDTSTGIRKHTRQDRTLLSGDVWFIPKFGSVLDKLYIQPGLWATIYKIDEAKALG